MKPSDEATREGLRLAREQGEAFQRTVQYMTHTVAHGAEQQAGDYLIGYAIEEAEGLYEPRDGSLHWQEPTDENLHVEVAVMDATDRRFIPGLTVHATLIDDQGREVGSHRQPFLWHPWLYHYGRNWRVPGNGTYTLRVRVEPPTFARHDKTNGRRYTDPVEIEFRDVAVKTGRKISS
jgi:hypothetical protein